MSSSKTLSDVLDGAASALNVLGTAEKLVRPGGPVPGTAAATVAGAPAGMPVGDDVAAETAASVDVWPASELPRSDERERVSALLRPPTESDDDAMPPSPLPWLCARIDGRVSEPPLAAADAARCERSGSCSARLTWAMMATCLPPMGCVAALCAVVFCAESVDERAG